MRTLVAFIGVLAFVCGAQAKTIHIVAFGDSATVGWLVDRKDAYPTQLQRMLRAKRYNVSVTNAGVSGDTTKHALTRLDQAIGPDTDIAIVEFGTNDIRLHVPAATMRRNLAEIVQTLRKRNIGVLLIGLATLDLTDVAKANDVPYVQWNLPPGKFRANDGQHFNAQGYRIVVTRMLPQIEKLIQRKHR